MLYNLRKWKETMLRLHEESRSDWVEEAINHLDEILLDHAHCEKKAASMALNLMFRYPHHPQVMTPLSELAREELRHFEQIRWVLSETHVFAKCCLEKLKSHC